MFHVFVRSLEIYQTHPSFQQPTTVLPCITFHPEEWALKPYSRTIGEISTGVYAPLLKSWELYGSCKAVQDQKSLKSIVVLKVPSSFCMTDCVSMFSTHLPRLFELAFCVIRNVGWCLKEQHFAGNQCRRTGLCGATPRTHVKT